MTNARRPRQGPFYDETPQAIDLIAVEDEIAAIDRRLADLKDQRFLIPGRKRKEQDALEARKSTLWQKEMVYREHIFANATSTGIYEDIKKRRAAEIDRPAERREDGSGFNADGWLLKRKRKVGPPKP